MNPTCFKQVELHKFQKQGNEAYTITENSVRSISHCFLSDITNKLEKIGKMASSIAKLFEKLDYNQWVPFRCPSILIISTNPSCLRPSHYAFLTRYVLVKLHKCALPLSIFNFLIKQNEEIDLSSPIVSKDVCVSIGHLEPEGKWQVSIRAQSQTP